MIPTKLTGGANTIPSKSITKSLKRKKKFSNLILDLITVAKLAI